VIDNVSVKGYNRGALDATESRPKTIRANSVSRNIEKLRPGVALMLIYEKRRVISGCAAVVILILFGVGSARGAECPKFQAGKKVGTIEYRSINEASGIAASRKNKGVLWVHNDDGMPRLYAVSSEGKHLGIYNIVGARMQDWEDIATGPGPDPNVDYIYIGAIGDNRARRRSVFVYRVAEPVVDANQQKTVVAVRGVEAIELTYPDGARDAETLMIDPLTRDLYIITKEKPGKVYRAAYPQTAFAEATADKSAGSKTTLEYVGSLPWGTATGGDISADGQMIIVRNYFAASVWLRPKDEALWKGFEGKECKVPLIFEPQGEAICFDSEGKGYFTTSENRHQPIYYYPIKQ